MGYMGSGKSTLGRLFSKEIGFDFIDLDDYLQKKNQYSIAQIFEKFGEDKFRELERQALMDERSYFPEITSG